MKMAAVLLLAAAPGISQAVVPSVAELDAVQGETLMMRAQAAKAKAAQELTELNAPASGAVDSGAQAVTKSAEAQLPAARGLFGANGTRYVEFLYSNGGMAEGKVGDHLPGGFKVIAFDQGGVDLQAAGGKRHRIPFFCLKKKTRKSCYWPI
ncbi:hypothetical protein B1810_24420 [Panacagrimonas perspica]|nr:hypothetical protein B1810_24420 [Panacagrimonas perspica]